MRWIMITLVPLALLTSAAIAQNTLPPQPPRMVDGQPIETRNPEKADDKPLFPNAQYYITQSDFEFWTDEGKLGSPLKDFVVHARKNLMPVRDRLVFIKDGQEFLPGVQAIAAPGHTVGHTIFMVTSAGKSFAFLGDLTHHAVLLLEKPRMEFSYDTDPKQAAGTRVKLLDTIAANKTPVMSYHFAWPGFGHVAKAGDGFHYYPEPMKMEL